MLNKPFIFRAALCLLRASIILTVLIFFQQTAYSQQVTSTSRNAIRAYNAGLDKYERGQYNEAINDFNTAIRRDPNFLEALLLMAESWLELKNPQQAKIAFMRSLDINPDFFPPVYFSLAEIFFNEQQYETTIVHLEKFLSYNRLPPLLVERSEKLLRNSRFAINAMRNPVPFHPENIGFELEYDQYWPSLTVDEQTLIFTALIPKNPDKPYDRQNYALYMQEDFYVSHFRDGQWTKPENLGPPLNTPNNEAAQSITADGSQMYFTVCNRSDGLGSCDIYFSERVNGLWTRPRNLGPPVNTAAWESQPSISADGKTLYFVSNRNGGKGGMDIWMSKRNDTGNWSRPINLEDINTSGNESSPFIHFDNRTLYFASDGWTGMGGFDLFVTRKDSADRWLMPQNLGYPINTGYNEEGMIVNARGNIAYYSSTRDEDIRNLFSFELYPEARPMAASYMKGKIYDSRFYRPLRAHFELIDLATAETVIESFSDSISGEFLVTIPSGRDYAMNIKRAGYLFYSENFTMPEGTFREPLLKDIPLKRIRPGEKVILRNIFFEFASASLLDESKVELELLLLFLRSNPDVNIVITGHTDNIGTEEYNLALSQNRARAVVDYLLKDGIAGERLSYRGLGASEPIADNDTEEGRAQNRRTEMLIAEPQ